MLKEEDDPSFRQNQKVGAGIGTDRQNDRLLAACYMLNLSRQGYKHVQTNVTANGNEDITQIGQTIFATQ